MNNWQYDKVVEISSQVRKEVRIGAYSYGYCCPTDYFDGRTDPKGDYIAAKLYRGGLNNSFHKDNNGKRVVDTDDCVYWNWVLSESNLDKVLDVMERVVGDEGLVVRPKSNDNCIKVIFKNANGVIKV